MPLLETKGAASAQGFGLTLGGAAPVYIEDVFSTWLYTGNSSGSGPIASNGIDLAGKGGLVWTKSRSVANSGHMLVDTVRGNRSVLTTSGDNSYLGGNGTNAAIIYGSAIRSFLANGFQIVNTTSPVDNNTGNTYASWAFRQQPKFFQIVTYTGNGGDQNIAHNLGAVPGCIIIKETSADRDWVVYHRSLGATKGMYFNTTDSEITSGSFWGNTAPTSTQFTVSFASRVNTSGATYIAYVFAHNAGGFGLSGTDNVISCGSYTGNGSTTNNINLDYEPQWILIKNASTSGPSWLMFDTMRGWVNDPIIANGGDKYFSANRSDEERDFYSNLGGDDFGHPNARGFTINSASGAVNANGSTYIYIAIRRGPMKVPTTGTSVFSPIATSAATGTAQTTNFPVDMQWLRSRAADATYVIDRLRGISTTPTTASSRTIYTNDLFAEGGTNTSNGWNNTGFSIPSQQGGTSSIYWSFRRAPGFFDEVCYRGTGSATTVSHNLGVAPELMIIKRRNTADGWRVYSSAYGAGSLLILQTNDAVITGDFGWFPSAPSASNFNIGTAASVNANNSTYVAYLFASAPGVSKVGSFTGTGATQVIDCGFTGGARFVLIKAASTTGDWYIWDSARGIVAGNDPYLVLNTTAADVTNTDWVDTAASGFELSNAGGNLANSNGVSYIFLAMA